MLKGLVRRRQAESELFLKPVIIHDEDLFQACRKLILSGVCININQWKRVDLIKLGNVQVLVSKLGGIDKLVEDKVIGDKDIWINKTYNVNHVSSLIIKYGDSLG